MHKTMGHVASRAGALFAMGIYINNGSPQITKTLNQKSWGVPQTSGQNAVKNFLRQILKAP
jgi:hypothetical protein